MTDEMHNDNAVTAGGVPDDARATMAALPEGDAGPTAADETPRAAPAEEPAAVVASSEEPTELEAAADVAPEEAAAPGEVALPEESAVPEEPAPAPDPALAAAAAEPAADMDLDTEAERTRADYERSFPTLSEGDVVPGVVVHIDREGVLVDVGAKSEGLIRLNELSREGNLQAEEVVSVGDRIDVYVMEAGSQDGRLILSKKRADFEKAWERVLEAKDQSKTITAMVTDRVKGGLVVDLGIRGFVPASHVGNGSLKTNLDRYVGQSIPLKVIEVDKDRRKVVLSNKLAVEEERQTRKAETVSSLQVGQIRRGIVRRLTNYGAFIDLGGIDGLLHISEMSWTRINHPQEVLKEAQEVDVLILKMDLAAGRVSLGLRQILPDPWSEIEQYYRVGDVITGAVTRIVPFGAFVQVDGGIEGIIPNSEMAGRKGGRTIEGIRQGSEVEVKVIDLRPEERKMTLSLRQARQEEETRRERRTVEEYHARPEREEPRFTIGDALRAKEEAAEEESEEA